ncbi:unnamed protein product [Lupinus luteus]|uniref:SLC26A/SulP transporter domain-containing protein n=1 Tax=Lupinus luteus TaxID=3873 RepID=A0AAV1XZ23_LUPLU
MNVESVERVAIPPPQPFLISLNYNLKETFFPDDPFKQFKNQPALRTFLLALQYFFPIFQWGPHYSFNFLKSDIISGITIASLAIPQGISYAKLANLPPILGLYSSFIPPMVYAMMGSSRDLAVGTMAVGSLLMASMLAVQVNPNQNPTLFLHLAFTATFFAGLLQLSLVEVGKRYFRMLLYFLPHVHKIFQQTTTEAVLVVSNDTVNMCYFGKLVGLFHSRREARHSSGELKKGLNPPSVKDLVFVSPYMITAIKTGVITGIIALAASIFHISIYFPLEGIAVGRSFAIFKNYNIDGNKEMIAFGTMNIVGSLTSCYLTSGPFSRTAVNYNAGCKTAASNIVMAIAVMLTLLFLTPLFYYTPLVVLASILVSAMIGLIDYEAAIHLWKIDKFDFLVCISSYTGVVFGSIEIGLVIALVLVNPKSEVMKKLNKAKFLDEIGHSWIYLTVEEAVGACNSFLDTCKPNHTKDESEGGCNV